MLRVAMYAGKGTNPNRLARALRGWGFDVTRIDEDALTRSGLKRFDVLYLPGGWYRFGAEANAAVLHFVKAGGGCVGSCAGAYLVGGYIPIIPGRVLRANFRGRLYLEPQRGSHPILRGVVRRCTRHQDRRWEPIAVTHLGGPMILPRDKKAVVASYDVEGEIGAIVAAEVGRGRAVAVASHPELRLVPLPAGEGRRRRRRPLLQGHAAHLVRNAVLWAARRRVPRTPKAQPRLGL
jgi:glutamine amidotransferase-like uncharacterized protein